MKTIVSVLFVLLCATTGINAQNLIAVQNGGTPSFYQKLDSAIMYTTNGDTLYISGGPFTYNNSISDVIAIDKELHLIGVGHNPDSTSSTNITKISASISFMMGSNKSSLEGIFLEGNIYPGISSDEDVDNIIISRSNVGSLFLGRLANNWSVRENIIKGGVYGSYSSSVIPYAQNNYFSNNIIEGQISSFSYNNVFANNICLFFAYNDIYGYSFSTFANIEGSIFQNNIFLMTGTYSNSSNFSCRFFNNLFVFDFEVTDGSLGQNNIINQVQSSIFISQNGNKFDYSHNYHLPPSSPGKNAGTDGTDIGIYGGAFPWKEGSIPFNPHFQKIQISPTTDNNGNLNVNIKVAAQER